MAVIAISEQIGARGEELGRLMAERLGYRFLHANEVIAQAAKIYRVTQDQLRVLDERQPHFWERLSFDVERLYTYFRAVALRFLSANNAVLAGRSVSLSVPEGVPGALRIRATAPFAIRLQRVMKDEKLGVSEAEKRVRDYDRETQARIQSIRGIDINDASLYDLVVNTGFLPLDLLTSTLVDCALNAEHQAGLESCAKVRDACIVAESRAALFAHPKIGNAAIEVEANAGRVRLSSDALVPPWDELARQVVSKIEGVEAVEFDVTDPAMPPQRT